MEENICERERERERLVEENMCEREGNWWKIICERERERLVEENMCEREREIGVREYA